MSRTSYSILSIAFFLLCPLAAAKELRIGVLAKRGASQAIEQWGPTAEYLSGKLQQSVVIIPIEFSKIDFMVRNARIEFLLANSSFYVKMEKKYHAKAIATLINSAGGKPVSKFGCVLFARKTSAINELKDVIGKKLMCVKYSSFGGGQMTMRLLYEHQINPFQDLGAFMEGGTHDLVVYAVLLGTVDAGTVRSDTLERMHLEGKIELSDFKIIHPQKLDFPFLCSTRLYPEWPMAVLSHVPESIAARVAAALLEIKPNSETAAAARIVGWEEPADYGSVNMCLKKVDQMVNAFN